MPEAPDKERRHVVEVEFDEFGWEAVTSEARKHGVSVEDLVAHATMRYLAEDRTASVARRPLRFDDERRDSV